MSVTSTGTDAHGTTNAHGTTGGAESAGRPERVVDSGRAAIDALDARILALVRERMEVSARIQSARIAAGGRRVHLAREMEVLSRYRDGLGRPGTALAMTLLELSRGHR